MVSNNSNGNTDETALLSSISEHRHITTTAVKKIVSAPKKMLSAPSSESTKATTLTPATPSRTKSLNARVTPTSSLIKMLSTVSTDSSTSSSRSSSSSSSLLQLSPVPTRNNVQQPPRRQKRSVHFASKELLEDVVGEVPNRNELTPDDYEALWYSQAEFRKMKKDDVIPTIKKMMRRLPLDETLGEEPRGLEHKTPRGSQGRDNNRYNAMDAVLDEQERQWNTNAVPNPDNIAKKYRQRTAHCQMNAYLTAKKDAEWVQQHNINVGADIEHNEKDGDNTTDNDNVMTGTNEGGMVEEKTMKDSTDAADESTEIEVQKEGSNVVVPTEVVRETTEAAATTNEHDVSTIMISSSLRQPLSTSSFHNNNNNNNNNKNKNNNNNSCIVMQPGANFCMSSQSLSVIVSS